MSSTTLTAHNSSNGRATVNKKRRYNIKGLTLLPTPHHPKKVWDCRPVFFFGPCTDTVVPLFLYFQERHRDA